MIFEQARLPASDENAWPALRQLVSRGAVSLACALALVLTACSDATTEPSGQVSGVRAASLRRASQGDVLHTEIVATGIPGAGAVCEIGSFLPGGALHDQPALAAFTEQGRVFDPARVLVASTSNFGALLARPSDAAGAILSLDPSGGPLSVPPEFAADGSQASAVDGDILLYTAQSPAFTHPINTPATLELASVGLPTGISLNNGSGRPWFSNAPLDSAGDGTVTVLNPNGVPTAIFAGNATNRVGTTGPGIVSGALGTTLISKSPDETAKPVFAAVLADGSVVQVHVTKGVDPLAPADTVTRVTNVNASIAESVRAGAIAREGMVFNWVPSMSLFIADPLSDRIRILDLKDDGNLFSTAAIRSIHSQAFDLPIDLAPAVREVASANFSSNTMLGAGSDIYVLNRGDNSILRMRQDGEVTARREIEAAVPGFRANGLAVSADNQTLYISATAPGRGGVLLKANAFGEAQSTREFMSAAHAMGATKVDEVGSILFSLDVSPTQGLGPLFNAQSCGACHASPFPGGAGSGLATSEQLVGRLQRDGAFSRLEGHGGPVARAHSINELGVRCGLPTGAPPRANVVSLRAAMTLRGNSLIDAIRERDIFLNAAAEPETVRGHVNVLADGRYGRFGWKADVATLVEFVGFGFRNEIGLTNPIAAEDEESGCGQDRHTLEADALPLTFVAKFIESLDPPAPSDACLNSAGSVLFGETGCATCHTPQLPGRGIAVQLYSDLLLHDMGPDLSDSMVQGSAQGREWRTMPLWKLVERSTFLHDGRAHSLRQAIAAHGGQATSAASAFGALTETEKDSLLQFLGCI